MALAKTMEEAEEIAAEETGKKIKNEVSVNKKIKPFLKRVNNEFKNEYIVDGRVVDAKSYKNELAVLLYALYEKIAGDFKNTIRESFKEKVTEEIDALINRNLRIQLGALSDQRSTLILNTTNKEIQEELARTIAKFVEEKREIVNAEIARETQKELDKGIDGRASIIAIAETETAAELTKEVEKSTLISNAVVLGGIALSESLLESVWVTVLDDRVRPAHAAAHGQKKKDGYFTVGGEFLRFPGDPNGSPGNIINCRCAAITPLL